MAKSSENGDGDEETIYNSSMTVRNGDLSAEFRKTLTKSFKVQKFFAPTMRCLPCFYGQLCDQSFFWKAYGSSVMWWLNYGILNFDDNDGDEEDSDDDDVNH